MLSKILIGLLLCAAGIRGATLKAGVARVDITPAGPIWMSGYAARTHPSDGTLTRLWAKALAFESSPDGRIVFVTREPRKTSQQSCAAWLEDKSGRG